MKKHCTRFYSPQEEVSKQEGQQWYSPSLDLVLKEVEGLHTNTAHTTLILTMQVVVTTAERVLQNKNVFGCIYTHTHTYTRL